MIRDISTNGPHKATVPTRMRIASQDKQVAGSAPTAKDVICGRGKAVFLHPGNQNFRDIVMMHLPEYKTAVSKAQKSAVVSSVFDEVTAEGNFIKQNQQTDKWYVVSEAAAREKISQCKWNHAQRKTRRIHKKSHALQIVFLCRLQGLSSGQVRTQQEFEANQTQAGPRERRRQDART